MGFMKLVKIFELMNFELISFHCQLIFLEQHSQSSNSQTRLPYLVLNLSSYYSTKTRSSILINLLFFQIPTKKIWLVFRFCSLKNFKLVFIIIYYFSVKSFIKIHSILSQIFSHLSKTFCSPPNQKPEFSEILLSRQNYFY